MKNIFGRVFKRITRRRYSEMYKDVFKTENGKYVISDLVEKFRVLRPYKMHDRRDGDLEFSEGQRQVVLYILTQIGYDLAALEELQKKYNLEISND